MPISEVYNEDCMIGMARYPDKYFELAIVDPPYGINASKNILTGSAYCTDRRNGKVVRNIIKRNEYEIKDWDSKKPDQIYFDELLRISTNQIIFGGNHFSQNLKSSTCWIVWDKLNVGTYQSDCELAWTSFDTTIRKFSFMWSGGFQGATEYNGKMQGDKKLNEKRIHPTQKPIPLYRWLLKNYAKPGDKIFDSHMGSQSSRIAAYQMGFDYWGFELDPDYFRDGCKRFDAVIHKKDNGIYEPKPEGSDTLF